MIWTLAFFVVTGFYLYLIFAVPSTISGEQTLGVKLALGASKVAQNHSIFLAMVSLAALLPALLIPQIARPYLLRVALIFGLIWGGVFLITSQPVALASIQNVLSTDRPMPETIRGP